MSGKISFRVVSALAALSLYFGEGSVLHASAQANRSADVVPKAYNFDFAGGTLADAFAYIRSLTGIQYLYADDTIPKTKVSGLSGRMQAGEAVAKLLSELALIGKFTDSHTVIITRARAQKTATASPPRTPEFMLGGVRPPLEEISVSSVRTTALGFKKISPTVVIDGDVFLQRPGVKIAQTLYAMPSVSATRSAENTVYLSYGNGVNMLDLRAMGVVRTLVTVNGRRHVPTNGSEPDFIAVDTNMLPAELVDRVEILTSGASVLYGADAVAGLVNVILKKDYEGAQVSGSIGLSEKMDSETLQTSAIFGSSFSNGRGHYSAYLSYQKEGGLKARDRYISADPAGFVLDGLPSSPSIGRLTRGFGYGIASDSGTVTGYQSSDGGFQNFNDGRWFAISEDGQSYSQYASLPNQRYNFASVADLISPNEIVVFNGNLSFDFNDNHQLLFEHTFGRATINQEIAPSPIYVAGGQGIFIGINNPTLPEGIRDLALADGGAGVTGVYVNRRLSEMGNRRSTNKRDLLRLAVGIEGGLSNDWSYSFFYQYGQTKSVEEGENGVDVSLIAASLSPDSCSNVPGCSLTNYFGKNSITDKQAAFARTDFTNRNMNAHHIATAAAEGSIFSLPAGSVPLRLGVHYRHESLKDERDTKIENGLIAGTSQVAGAVGSQDIFEAYAALSFPLLKGKKLAKSLAVDVGVRHSYFSSSGNALSWQAGFEYEPIEGFDIRGSYQEANRSPNISELFTGAVDTRFQYVDPCNGGGVNTVVIQNCSSDTQLGRLNSLYSQRSDFADGILTGNPNLNEEKAKTENIGFTIDSRLWGGAGNFVLAVDWFNINVNDFIRSQSLQYALNACYGSAGFDNIFCRNNPATGAPFFVRDGTTGEVRAPIVTPLNSGVFHASGLDVDLFWQSGIKYWLGGAGNFQLRAVYSYNFQAEYLSDLDRNVETFRGHVSRPNHKMVLDASYLSDGFTANWQIEYRGSALSNSFYPETVDGNLAPAVTYHHVSFAADFGGKLKVKGGVMNVFNKAAPFLAFNAANTFPEFYDVVGRRFYLGFSRAF